MRDITTANVVASIITVIYILFGLWLSNLIDRRRERQKHSRSSFQEGQSPIEVSVQGVMGGWASGVGVGVDREGRSGDTAGHDDEGTASGPDAGRSKRAPGATVGRAV